MHFPVCLSDSFVCFHNCSSWLESGCISTVCGEGRVCFSVHCDLLKTTCPTWTILSFDLEQSELKECPIFMPVKMNVKHIYALHIHWCWMAINKDVTNTQTRSGYTASHFIKIHVVVLLIKDRSDNSRIH